MPEQEQQLRDPEIWVRQKSAVVDQVVAAVEPLLNDQGFDLVDLVYLRGGGNTLRIYVDRQGREAFSDPGSALGSDDASAAGVTMDEISQVSRLLSDLLDVEEPLKGQYQLEVSSPGLERPLCRKSDFERALGLPVELRTNVKIDGQQRFHGLLDSIDDGVVCITVDDGKVELPISELAKARLEFVQKTNNRKKKRAGSGR